MRFILAILIVLFSTNCFAFWTKGTDTAPEVQTFCKRVLDDGGIVIDIEYMDKTVKLLKQLGVWGNVKFLADANFAYKSGVTTTVAKLYDLSGNNNDAVQATGANQPIWGSTGLIFNGTTSKLTVSDSSDWTYGTGNFTIIIKFRPAILDTYQCFISQVQTNGVDSFALDFTNLNKLQLNVLSSSVSVGNVNTTSALNVVTGTEYHLVIERYGATPYVFLDGISQPITITTAFGTLPDLVKALSLGFYDNGAGANFLNATISSIKIFKGVAIWTSNFTPGLL